MNETTPNLALPLVMPAQAQKHITVNEALLRLDALTQACVESRSLTVQPAAPGEGEVWILPEGASGADWSAMDAGTLAIWRDGFWTAISPAGGWQVYVRDEARSVVFDNSRQSWLSAGAVMTLTAGESGAATDAVLVEETLSDLSGATAVSSITIPARAIVIGVSVTTLETVTGAASFDCGIAGEAAKFGGALGVSPGASNIGVIGPTAFYSDTPVMLTANGGDFTGGSVAIAIHAWAPRAPEG
jgi:hypothetical protein